MEAAPYIACGLPLLFDLREDLFYIEGTGWCDIYGRTVDGTSPKPRASAPSRGKRLRL